MSEQILLAVAGLCIATHCHAFSLGLFTQFQFTSLLCLFCYHKPLYSIGTSSSVLGIARSLQITVLTENSHQLCQNSGTDVLFCIADTLLVIQKWICLLGFFCSFTSKDVSLKHHKVGSFFNIFFLSSLLYLLFQISYLLVQCVQCMLLKHIFQYVHASGYVCG